MSETNRPAARRVLTEMAIAAAIMLVPVALVAAEAIRYGRATELTAGTIRPLEVSEPSMESLTHGATRRSPRPEAERNRGQVVQAPSNPTGRLHVVRGTRPASGTGPQRRFIVEIEGGLPIKGRAFAAFVEKVLYDKRGWGAGGGLSFKRVDSGPVSFRVALASPALTDSLCAPLDTASLYSCHQDGRAVLNHMRWTKGADSYGKELRPYRTYMVNHEVGHALGHSAHRYCTEAGARAPVMMQQTKGGDPCTKNPWPLPPERQVVG